ncbi:MAG: hypothetical protein HKN00_07050, partial [Flavobacteriaceae bacterium]|nr:hypothetical protein [Flavobacteriaceae bacterium]
SSYQWNTIFNKSPKSLFDFEKGLMFKVSLNQREDSQIYIFPTEFYPAQALELDQNNREFSSDLFYPFKDEKLMISQYDKKGKPIVPKIFVQFKPSAIPDLKLDMFKRLPERTSEGPQESDFSQISFESLDRVQQLEGVTVVEDRTQTRLEQLSSKTMGEIDIFEDNDPKRNQFLSTYLSTRGYVVNEASGEFIIASRIPSTSGSNRPAIFLDGFLLFDYSILYQYQLNIIDYIEINPMGQGYGMYGGAGVIKIVTDPYRRAKYNSKPDYSTYEIPMAFEPEKRFYNPKYSSYSSGFFLKYGTLDWQPELRLEADGFLTIKFKNYGVSDIKLFLEGVVNGS